MTSYDKVNYEIEYFDEFGERNIVHSYDMSHTNWDIQLYISLLPWRRQRWQKDSCNIVIPDFFSVKNNYEYIPTHITPGYIAYIIRISYWTVQYTFS